MTLRPERRKVRRPKIAVFDLEWIPRTLQIRVAGLYDGERYTAYDSIPELLNTLLSSHFEGRWIYAHGGGAFDMQFLLAELVKDDRYQIQAHFAGSSAIIVKVRRGRHLWTFLDSYWLLKDSLRNIAKMLGRSKGGVVEEPDGSNREEVEAFFRDTPIGILRDYNQGDCVNLYDAIVHFEELFVSLGGELCMTLAGSAMMLFRRRFLSREIKTIPAVNAVARQAYVASRVEPFRRHCEEGVDWDINSSFPFAMLRPQPGNLIGLTRRRPDSGPYLARCTIRVRSCDLPPLPYRRGDGRIFFPVGTWDGWFTDVDLELLEETGHEIETFHEAFTFESITDLAGYASTLYELRRTASDETMRYVLKLFLNGLYGKFAERQLKTSLLVRPNARDFAKVSAGKTTMLWPGVFLLKEEKKVAHAHVPISAHITSIARAVLYRHMARARVLSYCDTDGFVCDPETQYEPSDKLGALKLVNRISKGEFLAPKLYCLQVANSSKRVIKAKGFRKLSYEEFQRLATQHEIHVERMARIRENIRTRGGFDPVEIVVKKKIHRKEEKREFHSDGTSSPWRVSDIERE